MGCPNAGSHPGPSPHLDHTGRADLTSGVIYQSGPGAGGSRTEARTPMSGDSRCPKRSLSPRKSRRSESSLRSTARDATKGIKTAPACCAPPTRTISDCPATAAQPFACARHGTRSMTPERRVHAQAWTRALGVDPSRRQAARACARVGERVAPLPEAPQHRYWREARQLAGDQMECLRDELRDGLAAASALLANMPHDSEPWHELAARLQATCLDLSSATHCPV